MQSKELPGRLVPYFRHVDLNKAIVMHAVHKWSHDKLESLPMPIMCQKEADINRILHTHFKTPFRPLQPNRESLATGGILASQVTDRSTLSDLPSFCDLNLQAYFISVLSLVKLNIAPASLIPARLAKLGK